MWNGIAWSDNGPYGVGRNIFAVTPRYHGIWGSNFRIHKISSLFKGHEENSKAEKAIKLAGVMYWVKDKHMMGDSLHKTTELSEISSADTEHSGYRTLWVSKSII